MTFEDYFPIWNKLNDEQKAKIKRSVFTKSVPKGRIIAGANNDCTGLFLIKSGQLRAYILSDEGREITIYRLFERDMCLFSASCMMRSIQFQITIETEKDSEIWVIPVDTYQKLMEESAAVANYTTEVMSTRFTDVMWLIEQVMWKSLDKRLASFLIEESAIEGSKTLKITHEMVANHLGSHREVITRMLKYFQNEGMVLLSRGTVEITDIEKLEELCK
jgi:CRP/FNR family transcriptional regulator